MGDTRVTPRRLLTAIVVGVALVAISTSTLAAPAHLQVELAAAGDARLAGDHETVIATVTNTGIHPMHDVILMVSLLDISGSPAVPLGVEDWTPTPEAVHAVSLAPGARLTGTWRLRMIQAGPLAIFATAVAGRTQSVTNSQPVVLNITPTRNLTFASVLPVALGIPLAVFGGAGVFFWRRRRVTEQL